PRVEWRGPIQEGQPGQGLSRRANRRTVEGRGARRECRLGTVGTRRGGSPLSSKQRKLRTDGGRDLRRSR
ncbi:hypothetical protein FRC01_011085, partial [Tulasnella sp. 417]